jgi:hypothetical protein
MMSAAWLANAVSVGVVHAAGPTQGVNSAPLGAANAVSVGVVHPSARTAVRRALCAPIRGSAAASAAIVGVVHAAGPSQGVSSAPLGAANAVSVGVVQP